MASLTRAPPPFVVHARPRAQVHKDNKVVQELPIAASKKVARTLRSKRMLAHARAVCSKTLGAHGQISIGRREDADWVIEHPSGSRQHA
jgi:hypothetical protein